MNVIKTLVFFFIVSFAAIFILSADEISSGMLSTTDGVDIAYDLYSKGSDSVIIVCPGFFNSKENRWMQKTVDLVREKFDVIIFDFRGHGNSGGKYTWSAKEDKDFNAALDYTKEKGYKHIGVIAFSLGAASAVNAVAHQDGVDSMILISCPTSFKSINYHIWEPGMFYDLWDNIESGWEGKGARTDHVFIPKEDPVETIKEIKNTPILFIHGDKDWVVKESHSKKLYETANTKKRLEIIKDGFHAERLVEFHEDEMQKLILDWFSDFNEGT